MTQYLLDADVVIDYLLGKDPGRQMVAHLFGSTLHLSVLAWAEVEYGIEGGQNQEHFQKSFREMLVNA
ncbi:MAG: hypothetical protein Q8R11_03340, partial [bacterium]|nr:hypothetical protein [bacterium]